MSMVIEKIPTMSDEDLLPSSIMPQDCSQRGQTLQRNLSSKRLSASGKNDSIVRGPALVRPQDLTMECLLRWAIASVV
jgi:hypothetical protein